MIGNSFSASIVGVDAHLVSVQTKISGAVKRFSIIGLPDNILKESKDRVRCAIEQSGFSFPYGDIVVSLSPATIPKSGSGFDLAIALSILAAIGEIDGQKLSSFLALGELDLDGSLKPVWGSIASAALIKEKESFELLAHPEMIAQASVIKDIKLWGVDSLLNAVSFINGKLKLEELALDHENSTTQDSNSVATFKDVIGQDSAKRALEIIAAGGHNLLMVGPPGVGKSMLAKRVISILPQMQLSEQIEVTKIYEAQKSATALGNQRNIFRVQNRPFRDPHYSTSLAGIIGGGSVPAPGEISLSHKGILFLDEVTEMKREVLESLRQPIETKAVTISRAKQRITYPADFTLIAAMNPCPCGKRGIAPGSCKCSPHDIFRYLAKLSGPILDRIDLQIWISPISIKDLSQMNIEDKTQEMKNRVKEARNVQTQRLGNERLNSNMSTSEIKQYCQLSTECNTLINKVAEKMNFSARMYYRVLKTARTIADLSLSENINMDHLAEAINYRVAINNHI